MINTMTYRGYVASMSFDAEDKIIVGRVLIIVGARSAPERPSLVSGVVGLRGRGRINVYGKGFAAPLVCASCRRRGPRLSARDLHLSGALASAAYYAQAIELSGTSALEQL